MYDLLDSSIDFSTEDNFNMMSPVQWTSKKAHDVQLSLEYAQECYSTPTGSCADFVDMQEFSKPQASTGTTPTGVMPISCSSVPQPVANVYHPGYWRYQLP